MKLFLTLRILDIITTLLNVQKYGNWDVELNPIMKVVGSKGLVIPYQILITLFFVFMMSRFKYRNVVYFIMNLICFFVVTVNIYCLFL